MSMDSKHTRGSMNLLYLIFSICVAVALWAYVVYVENPTFDNPRPRSGIPLEFVGEDLLRDYNLIVSGVSTNQITVYFDGRARDAEVLSDMEIRAVVDLSDVLTSSVTTGTHALSYDLIYNAGSSSLEEVSRTPSMIEVTIDRLVTESIPLQAVYDGSIADDYMPGTLSLNMDYVAVSGTEAAINLIDHATVTLKRDNLSKTVTEEAPIVLWDAEGKEIDMAEAGLSFNESDGMAKITQTVLLVKTVPLKVDIVESATATDANIRVNYSVPNVILSGDPEIVQDINEINIGTINLKSIILSYEEDFLIRYPNNTVSESGETSCTVTITVEDMETRRLSATNISYNNAAEGDIVSVITQSLDITLRGDGDVIDQVTAENIRIVANLTEYAGKKGTYQVTPRVYVDGFGNAVEAVGDHYTVTVIIS